MDDANENVEDLLEAMVNARAESELSNLRAERSSWRANPSQPYLLTFTGAEQDRPHRFCPDTKVIGGQCPNCRKPLTALVSFDTARLPFSLARAVPPWIHLLYCWTCAIPYGSFCYRFGPAAEVEIVDYVREDPSAIGPDGPYEGYTGVFPPSMAGLRALTPQEQDLALELRAHSKFDESYRYLTDPVHQVGGFPMIYNPIEVFCGICARPCPFFATICDNAVGQEYQTDETKTFTANSGVQMVFHYCAECSAITAYHSCD